MAISFNDVPAANRVPFVFVEFDNSNAIQGPQTLPYRALLIGQKTSAGTADAEVLQRVTSAQQVKNLAGAGSVLAGMAVAWFEQQNTTELYILPVEDDASGTAATGSLAFSGSATAAGAINLMIAGQRVRVAVASGDTAATVAASVVTAITAATDLPVTASATTGTVTLTAKNDGETGNEIDLRVNYFDGEETAAGVTLAITAMSGGANNPDLTDAIAAMGDEWFNIIAMPFTDAANLTLIETEMTDRWGPVRQIEGHVFTGASGTVSALGTLGDSRNSPHLSIVPAQNSPTPSYEIAAETAAIVSFYGNIDQARPFQTLPYKHVKVPAAGDEFTQSERNLLLFDGIATWRVGAGSVAQVERLVTTYSENAAGGADTSYLDVNTLLTLGYIRWDFRNHILRKFPRHKLANDGTRIGPGQAVVTPKSAKAEALVKFRDWELIGLVEDAEQFKRDIIVERNASDPNRLDFYLPPNLVNQFRVGAAQIGFIL